MNAKKDSTGKNGLEDADELLAAQLSYLKSNALRAIFKHPNSWPFHKPVDVVQLDLPDYYSIIKKPMDMGTIQQKIDSQQYSNAQECIDDFKLMCGNCYLYNGPNDEVVLMCKELEDIFDKKIRKMPTELNHVKKGRGRTTLTGPTPGPAAAPTSNGGVAGNSSLNSLLHVKKEPKMVPPNTSSFVPTTQKNSNAVEQNRLTSDTSSVTAATSVTARDTSSVAAATGVTARDAPMTLETHSFVGGTSISPITKMKKSVKRKAEDNSPMRVALDTPRCVSSHPVAPVEPAPINERRGSSGRSTKRVKKEAVEVQPKQSTGPGCKKLQTEALTYCHGILLQLFQKPLSTAASHFYNCVDAKNPGMDNYFDIIKRPMSLMAVKKNLENDVYHRSSEFAKDMRQIFTNCYRFYSPEEEIVRAAKTVQDFFELNFAKAPDDPPELASAALPTVASDCDSVVNRATMNASDFDGSPSESSCSDDNYDSDQEKREAKLKLLQDQLFQVQQEVMRLSQNIEKGKKKKSKKPPAKYPDAAAGLPDQPLIHATKAAEPAVRPQTKPVKPARTKLPLQKKATGSKAVPKPPAKAAPVDIPGSHLPPPPPPLPQTSVHLSHKEQNQLREDISRLPEDAQYSILQIIHNQGTSLNVSGDEIVIDFETLKPSTIMEMRAFVTECSKDSIDKKCEPETNSEDLMDILADDELRKPDTPDNSPVHPVGHLLPQQPMRPSTTAAPKPPPRMLNVPSASSSVGSQVQQPMPELTAAISPPPSAAAAAAAAAVVAESRQFTVDQEKPESPPFILQEPAFPKNVCFADQKILPGSDHRWLDDPLDEPLSPPASSSSLAPLNKIPTAKPLLNNSEDSTSPKANTRPVSMGASVKPGSSAAGPFGVDTSKAATQKESTSKPSITGWKLASLAANTRQSSTPKPVSHQQTNSLQFNRFKQIAAERQERERMNQEKETMRQQRLKVEEDRERRRKEEQQVRKDEESSVRTSNSSEHQVSSVSPVTPAAAAAVEQPKAKDSPLSEQQLKEQERLREQQRRRMEAQSNKIDMNFQSDLLASFESNYHFNSTL